MALKKVFIILIVMLITIAAFVYSRYIPMGRIMPNIYAIRNDNNGVPFVNFFLFRVGENFIAFDVGSDIVQTENALQRLNISADNVIAVFVTHEHADHIASLSLFENAIIHNESFKFPDGYIMELHGVSIQIIHTPGHTSGCVVYLVNDRYLFAGDLFVNINFAEYCGELQLQSREAVLGIDSIEYIFTGHFNLFRGVWFYRWRF